MIINVWWRCISFFECMCADSVCFHFRSTLFWQWTLRFGGCKMGARSCERHSEREVSMNLHELLKSMQEGDTSVINSGALQYFHFSQIYPLYACKKISISTRKKKNVYRTYTAIRISVWGCSTSNWTTATTTNSEATKIWRPMKEEERQDLFAKDEWVRSFKST